MAWPKGVKRPMKTRAQREEQAQKHASQKRAEEQSRVLRESYILRGDPLPDGTVPINVDQLKELAIIQCTLEEMSAVLNVSANTLDRRFGADIRKWKESGKSSLRRKQYLKACAGDTGALIWLGKVVLKQREVDKEPLTDQQLFVMKQLGDFFSSLALPPPKASPSEVEDERSPSEYREERDNPDEP